MCFMCYNESVILCVSLGLLLSFFGFKFQDITASFRPHTRYSSRLDLNIISIRPLYPSAAIPERAQFNRYFVF